MRHATFAMLSICIFCTSCYQNLHFLSRANSINFREKGEYKITGAVKANASDYISDTTGIKTSYVSPEFCAAYAITDHIALAFTYSSVLNRYSTEGSGMAFFTPSFIDSALGGSFNQHLAEVGGGWFSRFGKTRSYSVFLHLGYGTLSRRGAVLPKYDYNTQIFKYSIQQEMAWMPAGGDLISFSTGIKFSGLQYFGFSSTDPDTRYILGSDTRKRTKVDYGNKLYPFFEPYTNLEIGLKKVKFNFQAGLSVGMFPIAQPIGEGGYVSVGFLYHFRPAKHISAQP